MHQYAKKIGAIVDERFEVLALLGNGGMFLTAVL